MGRSLIDQIGGSMKIDLITENFDNPILYNPALKENGHNVLKIITGYTDCERISTHMINLADGIETNRYVKDLSIDILVGMSKSSISLKKHNEICRLIKYLSGTRYMPKISCRYINQGTEVHSKVYIWGKPSRSQEIWYDLAYIGSLNYTMNGSIYYARMIRLFSRRMLKILI